MIYYLLLTEDNVIQIGEVSFKKFYAYDGWYHLEKLVKNEVEPILERIQIVSENNKKYTIEEFYEEMKNYKLVL